MSFNLLQLTLRHRTNISIIDTRTGIVERQDPPEICITCEPAICKTKEMCKGCRNAFYCSRECQKLDWRAGHKLICVRTDRYPGKLKEREDVVIAAVQYAMQNVQTMSSMSSIVDNHPAYGAAWVIFTAIKMHIKEEDFRQMLECDTSDDIVPLIRMVVSLPEGGGLKVWTAVASGTLTLDPDMKWNEGERRDGLAIHFIAMGEGQASAISDLLYAGQIKRIDAILSGNEAAQFNMMFNISKAYLFHLILN
jgi:hypothetical protein